MNKNPRLKKRLMVMFIILICFLFTMAKLIHSKNCLEKKEDVIRIGTYNMMFGMYGKSGPFNILGHLAFHGVHSVFLTKMLSVFNKPTASLIKNANLDIVVLNEVLGTLRKDVLIKELNKTGFKYFCWGPANHYQAPLDLGTLVASKYPAEKLNFSMTQSNKVGGGGGVCAIYIKDKNLVIIGVHLGQNEELAGQEITEIASFIKEQQKKEREVLLVGDFNREEKELNKYPDFKNLSLVGANRKKTCPNIKETKLFYFESVDNIYHNKSVEREKSCVVEGYSDHLLVWADLKI